MAKSLKEWMNEEVRFTKEQQGIYVKVSMFIVTIISVGTCFSALLKKIHPVEAYAIILLVYGAWFGISVAVSLMEKR